MDLINGFNFVALAANSSDTIGGGEVLQYVGQDSGDKSFNYMDNSLMQQLFMHGYAKIAIVILLAIVVLLVLMHIFRVKTVFKGAGVSRALEHIEQVKKHDKSIIRTNKLITQLRDLVEATPFKIDKTKREYLQYNISRCGIKIPGGIRDMTAEEFNALVEIAKLASIVLGLLIMIFISIPAGITIAISLIIILSIFPMVILRSLVGSKDDEIRDNFSNFYLMIHYTLMANANTPLSSLMKSYDKTTDSQEMHKFVSVCIHNIETYGEYEATNYIAKEYREIPEVGKLMRLIRQANEGGEVKTELIGFRTELLNATKYKIEKNGDKLVKKGQASFNVLMIILIQAIISAMSIYFPDIFSSFSMF